MNVRLTMQWKAMLLRGALLLVCAFVDFSVANAQLGLANIFADNMVLQSGLPVPVWGSGTEGTKVHVEFGGQSHRSVVGHDGRWSITLDPMRPSNSPRELVVRCGNDQVVRKDVVVGEVWLAAGQSNMAYTCRSMATKLAEGKAMVSAANLPLIRFCRINESDSPEPLQDLAAEARWDVCTPQSVLGHSAVAFVFARRLQSELGIPIGLIDCSWGGKPIEPFIPSEDFKGHPTLLALGSRARAGDIEGIQTMVGGTYVRDSKWLPGAIYNGRVSPIVPFGIRGAIWYQGESNCGRGEDPRDYEHKMRALVRGWRRVWSRPDLPVYFVQLPQWTSYAWTFLREEQRRAAAIDHSGMVVTIDLDNDNDIHPPNKIDVGERLARWPLANEYARDVAVNGPMYRGAEFRKHSVRVSFDPRGTALMVGRVAGVRTIQRNVDDSLNGFELADEDGIWHEANAIIDGDDVIVTSSNVARPVAVRYACYPEPKAGRPWNLYSSDGLPSSPFCSDWSLMPFDPTRNR